MEEDLENAYKTIDILTKINMILTVLIYMVFTKILVINMILTVLIETPIT